jgi:hypothetical protein
MLTAADLIAAYGRLAPKRPSRDDAQDYACGRAHLERVYRQERRRLRRAVCRQHKLDAWVDLSLPCYREARTQLVRYWRNLAAYYAEGCARLATKEAELAAKEARLAAQEADTAQKWTRLVQGAEAVGVLAKWALYCGYSSFSCSQGCVGADLGGEWRCSINEAGRLLS